MTTGDDRRGRRRLLQGLASVPLAAPLVPAAAPVTPRTAPPADAPQATPEEPAGRGYRLSAHVQRFYDLSRY